MGISGINPRRRHIPTGPQLHAGGPDHGQLPADAAKDAVKDAEKKDAEKKKDDKARPGRRST